MPFYRKGQSHPAGPLIWSMEHTLRGGGGSPAESGQSLETASGRDMTNAEVTYEFDEQDNVKERGLIYQISTIIAEQTDVDICELPPLYGTIDPDAFDAFLRCSDGSDTHHRRSVEFSYCGFRVLVDSTGHVELRPETESTVPIPSIRG